MKISFKAKRIIKAIALALAGVAAITAIAFGVKAIVNYTKSDLKEINPSFEVGSLGADGKYVADEGSLYTKEAFGCYGLQVKPDFDSTVNYQLFYYDILDNYISSSEVLSAGYSAEAPLNGAYARMVITPRDDEDGTIGFTERIKYSNQLTVKVKKDQKINERFCFFDGRIMHVVSDVNDLVFVNGLRFLHDTFTWDENMNYCSTSCTLLKVDGFSAINFDYRQAKEEQFGSTLYEFSGFPSIDTFVGRNSDQIKYELNKKTKFVILSTYFASGWNDAEVAKLPNCFSLSK